MAHLRSSSYYQDSHDDYASSSSSHRQPYHPLQVPKTERRGRPAYTTVRPFIINSTDDHHRPVRRERDDHDEHHRRVGDYVTDRLVPTMLRTSDRPVEVFMNFGDANLALPNLDHRSEHGHGRRASSKGPNAIIYNAPGCSLTIDGRRCDRYCDRCDLVDRDHRERHRHHDHDHHRELDLDLDRRHHHRHPRSRSHVRIISNSRNPSPSPLPLPLPIRDRHYHLARGLDHEHENTSRHRDRHPRSHSHIHIVSNSRNPSPSPLPLPGLFPIATAVEKATCSHSTRGGRGHGNGISHALHVCPSCLIMTTVYKDGYCADCDPPRYSPSSSRRADVFPPSSGTRVQYVRETDGSASDDSWARVEVGSRADRDRRRTGRGRSMERVKVYDVLTDNRGYGGDSRRRGGSRWEKERRSMPRYSGYASESDL